MIEKANPHWNDLYYDMVGDVDPRFRAAWPSAGRALGAAVLRGRRSGDDKLIMTMTDRRVM